LPHSTSQIVPFINLSLEKDHSALATVAGIVKNKIISVMASWKLEYMALCSHINKVNNYETVEIFSRSDLKHYPKDSN
jgi:hypothetical protein